MKPGFYEDITSAEYHTDPCDGVSLTQSIANVMVMQSPWHAHRLHPKLGGKSRVATDAKDAGSLMHALLLGQEHAFAVMEVDDFRTKAARELRDDAIARGKTPVKKVDFDAALEHAARIDNTLRRECGIELGSMKRELTAVWNERTDVPGQAHADVLCRARFDAFDGETIWDLKTCADASEARLARLVNQFGYHVQGAAYMSAVERLDIRMAGRVHFGLIFIENETGAVARKQLDGTFLEMGRRKWQACVNAWHQCLSTGIWPGYSSGDGVLECPEYARMSNEYDVAALRRKVFR